jgi:hypothetical protein
MGDLLYLTGTLAFFAVMIAYARAIGRLGERAHTREGR